MISVVTITFNNFNELYETTESLKKISDIEHLIINGGKCSETKNFLENQAKSKYVSEPDRGISDAFSKGARLSTGIGVAYLNSGDIYIGGDYYQKANEILENNPNISFVHSNILYKDTMAGELLMKPQMKNLGRGMPYLHPTMVVRKSVFEKIGYFPIEKKIGMDFDFICRMEKIHLQGVYIDGPPVVLMDGSGVSATQEEKALQECFKSLKEHELINGKNLLGFVRRSFFYKSRKALLSIGAQDVLIKMKKLKYKN